MLNYYRRFLPATERILKPLSDVLHSNMSCSKQLTWSQEMLASIAASKNLLINTVPLAHPDPAVCIVIAANDSNTHIGEVLQQVENGALRLLGLFHRKLSPTEMR